MKIRINQDVTFNWKLTVGGESVDLSKLELSVEITTPSNKKVEITPNIQFDTLEFNYRPKQVGEYILSAYLNRFKDGETALDIKAFEGVKYTWNQDFSTDDNLEANYVELAGDFNFGPNISSAPDVPSDPSVDLSRYAEKSYVDTHINNEATARSQADSKLQSKINSKQDKIIAGTGINITNNTISCTLDTTIFKVVNSLPATPSSRDKNKIHLVLSTNSEERNYYDEYLWVNNSWEKIGSFIPSVDLSDYATTSYVDTKASYIDTQINDEVTARTQADSELQSKINTKQDTLTAGENIKIENNVISAIDLRPSVDLSDYAKKTYVDTQIASETTARTQADSELQSKINTKQDKIIAGTGINITDNTISCTLDTTIFKVVNSLPATPPSSDKNKIHLVLSGSSEEGNTYDEYLWVNNSWEKIGTFIPSVDLSDYAKTTYVDTQIASESTARTQADTELQTKINAEVNARTQADTELQTHINDEISARTQADAELQSKINTKQDTLTAGENINIENNVISAINDVKLSLNTTWAELKGMRDNSQLVAGQQYRITDYTCTTTYVATKSAGHVFDIIVTADDESTINEVARAVKHDGDEYFANSDLSAWKIWYCIDNDTNRFAWADSTNGKGVIYRMIDEFNNDVPYDFKNIQFYRQWDDDKQLWCTISTDNTGVPCYTFSSSGVISTVEFTDTSLSKSNYVYSNSIKWFIKTKKKTLNNICFFGTTYYENKFLSNCGENTFGNNCSNNSFGESCYSNVFGAGCHSNSFGHDLHSNTFANGCGRNTLGNKCENNLFGWGCSGNTFGSHCSNNIFVQTLLDNTFGNDCSYNSFGEMCSSNSFGNDCSYNSFGGSCKYNSFGNECSYIKFAPDSSATTAYSYYQNNHFGDGCEYIVFTGAESVSSATNIQNYNFAQGLQGTSDNYLIVEGKRNRKYETKVAKNSKGEIKIYCEADSIQ